MNKKYKLIALIGESGSGKDSILNHIVENYDFHGIVPYTTRPKRKGEIDDVNYHFVSIEKFQHLVEIGRMVEYTSFNNWFYGTGDDDFVSDRINIGVFSPAGLGALINHPDIDLRSYRIYAADKERLLRQLNRESEPDVDEIIRRYRADQLDFARIGLVFPEMHILYNNTISDYATCIEVITNTTFGHEGLKII